MGRTPVGGGPAFRFIPSEVRAHSKTSSFSSSPPFFVASSFWCRLLHVDFWHEVLGLLFCCVLDFSAVHFEKSGGMMWFSALFASFFGFVSPHWLPPQPKLLFRLRTLLIFYVSSTWEVDYGSLMKCLVKNPKAVKKIDLVMD
jgi:hypothetical protein